jgi:hypothetical protein
LRSLKDIYYLNNCGAQDEPIKLILTGHITVIRKEAYRLQFRRRKYRYVYTSSELKEQPFEARGVVDGEFIKLDIVSLVSIIINTNASEA